MSRILQLAFGIASYLVFVVTLPVSVGFIGNIGLPRTLDGPLEGSFATALAVDIGLLLVFSVQHSLMARKWFKERWTRIVPEPIERSAYVLLSSAALLLLFWQWRPLGGELWTVEHIIGRFVLYGLFTWGWVLVFASTLLINHFDLFGLRQVWLAFQGKPYVRLPFVQPGAYSVIRHPLYLGWLFVFWMTPTMTLSHLVFAVATTSYILIAIVWEERDLAREHGEAYLRYQASTPKLIPTIRAPREVVASSTARARRAH